MGNVRLSYFKNAGGSAEALEVTDTNNYSTTKVVTANQEINPLILERLADSAKMPGGGVLHEVTEAYQGALISRAENNFAKPATQSDALDPTSIYLRAHKSATMQPGGMLEIKYMTKEGLIFKNPTGLSIEKAIFESNGKTIFTRYIDGTFTPY